MGFEITQQTPRLDDVYIDIHCHQATTSRTLEVISIDTPDFDPTVEQKYFYSLGLHPWRLNQEDIQTALNKIIAASKDPKMLAIGECGLDQAIAPPLALQAEAFIEQIKLAHRLGKPLIVHCVRSFNQLIQIKKIAKNAETPWIVHGFNRNPALAAQLIKHGVYLSFGAALLNPCSRAKQALLETPPDRLFLETDTAELAIDAIYAAAAKMLGVDVAPLRQQILSNFKRVFLND